MKNNLAAYDSTGQLMAYNINESTRTQLEHLGFTVKEITEQQVKDLLFKQWVITSAINKKGNKNV